MKTDYTIHTAEKILLMIARSGGIAIVSAIFLIFIGGQISASAEKIMKARGNLAVFNKKIESFDQIKKEREAMAGNMPKLESSFPSLDNLPVIADYFNALGAKTNNILTVNFNQGIRINELSLAEIAFTLRASGTPQSIANLLAAMENAPYFIKINGVALSSGDNMRSAELNTTGVVYLKNDDESQ